MGAMKGRVQHLRRRGFLLGVGALAATRCRVTEPDTPAAQPRKPPLVLLRSGWQTENIGDIAHTPGVLRLLRQFLSEAKLILWSNALDRGVREMLEANFPGVRIISGSPEETAVRQVFDEADFLLHGSGPSVVARNHLAAWNTETGKPYGIFGVTITLRDEAASGAMDPELRHLLEGARFVYTRETRSLENLKRTGFEGPEIGFAPDSTFSLKLSNDEKAKAFLAENGLKTKQFIAVVPRLRYTPYHQIRRVNLDDETIRRRTAVNKKHAEADHAKLREVIIRWVRETGFKVLLCPEMTYALDVIDPLLYNPLPADVKKNVVRRKTYWITDEAASVYRRASAVVSFECHSPIIAVVNDTPSIYIHQPEDGIKGQMWKDVGLSRWYFEVEHTSGAEIADRLMDIHAHYPAAQVDAHEAVLYARKRQSDGMGLLRRLLLG